MQLSAWTLLILAQAVQTPPPVTFLTGAELLRAIETAPEEQAGHPGTYLVRLSATSDYPVIGVRRTVPGRSELHARFTDVWYVLQGTATLVTGGSMVDGSEGQPGETRGSGIAGGDTRRIRAGEFAVIPAGVPHWVREVEGKEVLYLVVKVPANK